MKVVCKDGVFLMSYTERTQECEKCASRVIGITETKRKLLRIFTKIHDIFYLCTSEEKHFKK